MTVMDRIVEKNPDGTLRVVVDTGAPWARKVVPEPLLLERTVKLWRELNDRVDSLQPMRWVAGASPRLALLLEPRARAVWRDDVMVVEDVACGERVYLIPVSMNGGAAVTFEPGTPPVALEDAEIVRRAVPFLNCATLDEARAAVPNLMMRTPGLAAVLEVAP